MESKLVPTGFVPASPWGQNHAAEFEGADGIEAAPQERAAELLPESSHWWPAL
jgi:hypothetical protein